MKKLLGVAMLSIVAGVATGQTQKAATGAQTAKLALDNALEISFTTNEAVNIQFNSLNDMLNGVETATHEIKVRSNKKFKVTVKPSSNSFTYSGSSLLGSLLSVSNVMKIRVIDNNTGGDEPLLAKILGWQPFSNLGIPVTLLTGCDPGNNQTFTVKYKATPGINVVAGTYTTEMVYTATQQ